MRMLKSRLSRYARSTIASRAGLTSTFTRCLSNTPKHDPLRILFCGADAFSIYSLKTVHELQKQLPNKIASIDVVCRPPKRTGRGLKNIQEVPIKAVAQELQLPVHQIDTFTGWTPPTSIDLVVAVSFGLLVPARILTAATYGGWNVHPSLLPDLRGPAPIQHAILKGKSHTGVSLQTMHPTRFDHGVILDQAPIEIPDGSTTDQLIHTLGSKGAEGLDCHLRAGLFTSPTSQLSVEKRKWMQQSRMEYAPKITPEDRHIDWNTWMNDRLDRHDRALGKLWDTTTYGQCTTKDGPPKRTIFGGPWRFLLDGPIESLLERRRTPGQPVVCREPNKEWRVGIYTANALVALPATVTIEGGKQGAGSDTLINMLGDRKDCVRIELSGLEGKNGELIRVSDSKPVLSRSDLRRPSAKASKRKYGGANA